MENTKTLICLISSLFLFNITVAQNFYCHDAVTFSFSYSADSEYSQSDLEVWFINTISNHGFSTSFYEFQTSTSPIVTVDPGDGGGNTTTMGMDSPGTQMSDMAMSNSTSGMGDNGMAMSNGTNGMDDGMSMGEDGMAMSNGTNGDDGMAMGEDGMAMSNGTNGMDDAMDDDGMDAMDEGMAMSNGTNGDDGMAMGEDGMAMSNGTNGDDGMAMGEDGMAMSNGTNGMDDAMGGDAMDAMDEGMAMANGTDAMDAMDAMDDGMEMGKKKSLQKGDFMVEVMFNGPQECGLDLSESGVAPLVDELLSSFGSFGSGGSISELTFNEPTSTNCDDIQSLLDGCYLDSTPTDYETCMIVEQQLGCVTIQEGKSLKQCAVDITSSSVLADYSNTNCLSAKQRQNCPCDEGICSASSTCTCNEGFSGKYCSDKETVADLVTASLRLSQSCSSVNVDELGNILAAEVNVDSGSVSEGRCVSSKDGTTATSEVTFDIAVVNTELTNAIVAAIAIIATNPAFAQSGFTINSATSQVSFNIYIVVDCNGSPYNGAMVDLCGVCEGNNECFDCAGVRNGELEEDACGVCGGIAQSKSDCIEIGSPECQDNEEFVDETGMMCADWMSYPCAQAQLDYGMTAQGVYELLQNCPFSCRQCVGSCVDRTTFVDEFGLSCTAWMGYDCNTASEQWGYSAQGQSDLIESCPYSCNTCEYEEESNSGDDEDSNSSVAIGVGVGIAAAVVIAVVAFFVTRKSSSNERSKIHQAKVVYDGETTL